MRLLAFLCLAFTMTVAATAITSAAPPAAGDLVKASLLADTTAIQPGQPFRVGVLLKIAPQWHVYWQNPGEGGIPTTITLRLPEGFAASPVQYPMPLRFSLPGGLYAFGYEDQVMLLVTITPPAKIDSSNVTIGADGNWLVCEKVCVAGDASLSLALPVGATKRADHQDLFNEWSGKLPVPIASARNVASYRQSSNGSELSLRIEWKGPVPSDLEWFPPASDALMFNNVRIDTQGSTTTISTTVEQLPGQTVASTLPDSVLAFRTAAGRSGLAVPVKFEARK